MILLPDTLSPVMGPSYAQKGPPKFWLNLTLELPQETNFLGSRESHKTLNGPCQTNFLLQRSRQPSPKCEPEALFPTFDLH